MNVEWLAPSELSGSGRRWRRRHNISMGRLFLLATPEPRGAQPAIAIILQAGKPDGPTRPGGRSPNFE